MKKNTVTKKSPKRLASPKKSPTKKSPTKKESKNIPIDIYILPIDVDVHKTKFQKYHNDIIKIQLDIHKYTYKKFMKLLNDLLLERIYMMIHEFFYLQEDGDIIYINDSLSKKGFKNFQESMLSNNTCEPRIIIVNSDMD